MRYVILACLLLCGCSTTPLEQKREKVLDCTKDLIGYDADTTEAFEVCRQVYKLKKLKE